MIFEHDQRVPKNVQRQYYSHYAELRPRAVWMDDQDITQCMRCEKEFSLFVRKHHCRHCGRIFCYDCCHKWCSINTAIRIPLETPNTSILQPFRIPGTNPNSGKQRVCTECSISLSKYETCQKWFNLFNLIGLDFKDIMVIGQVNRQWRLVSEYYAKIFRNIQYRIPQTLNEVETIMLKNNCSLLSGHSVWVIQLCKLLDLDKTKHQIQQAIICTPSTHIRPSCWSLRCSRNCNVTISAQDAINCIQSCVNHSTVLQHIFQTLSSCPIFQLECYLHILVSVIGSEVTHPSGRQHILDFLMDRCAQSLILSHKLFWLFTLALPKNRDIFFKARTLLLQKITPSIKKQIHTSYEYISMLKMCSQCDSENTIVQILDSNSLTCKDNTITYPLRTDLIIVQNLSTKIVHKYSTTKPIIIPVDCLHKITYDMKCEKFLLKKDDVRQDCLIMDCIIMMDQILKKNGMDFHIVDYRILPITPKLGMVEIIQNALTIHEIQTSNFSIQNYILENNTDITVHEMRDHYTKSCAAYCLIGYLLGIGDRHLENIMITKTGYIFHIDFEFILGQDPKFIRPEIRITPEMIDAMGGFESKYYTQFKNLCKEAFQCLRRHSTVFYNHLLLLSSAQPAINDKFTPQFIHSQVMKRFMVGDSYEQAELCFITKVIKSTSSSYKHTFVDFAHESGQTMTSLTGNMFDFFGYSKKGNSSGK